MKHSRVPSRQHKLLVILTGTVLCVAVLCGLYWGRPILIPIAMALLLSVLLNPLVHFLRHWGLGRIPAVFVTVIVAGILVTAMGWMATRQITGVVAELPQYTTKITTKVRALKQLGSGETAQRLAGMVEQVSRELGGLFKREVLPQRNTVVEVEENPPPAQEGVVVRAEPSLWTNIPEFVGSVLETLGTVALAFVLLVFFLLQQNDLRDRLVLLAGRAHLTITSKALQDISDRISTYITMIALVNGGFGLSLAIGLSLMGLPYAFLWGILAAFLRFLPYVGPWIGALFPIVMSLAISDTWTLPLAVFSFVLILELITNNVVEPVLIGHSTGVSPTAMLISAAFWLYLWGPMGLIFSPPIAVCLVVIGKNVPQLRFLNIVIGDQPALSAALSFYQRLILRNEHEADELLLKRLAEVPPEEIYDDLLIPALIYIRRDEQRDQLNDQDYATVRQELRRSVAQVRTLTRLESKQESANSPAHVANAIEEKTPRRKVVLCPATDESDSVALEMLAELLDRKKWDVELISDEMLVSELVAKLSADPPHVICLAPLPPRGLAHAGYFCKRLRTALPDTPLIVGRWGRKRTFKLDRDRLLHSGATAVTRTLLETRQALSSYFSIARPAPTRPHLRLDAALDSLEQDQIILAQARVDQDS
ncbi:MAG: AI-2E family transporter [Planctomycetales bacterium]